MEMQLNIMDGNMDDVVILKNILDTYGIRSEILQANMGESDMGGEFLPVVVLMFPEVTQFIKTILPALQTYFETRKPSGTKHSVEVYNGDKKIIITHEDGKEINEADILEYCKSTHFFE